MNDWAPLGMGAAAGKAPFRGGYAAEQERLRILKEQLAAQQQQHHEQQKEQDHEPSMDSAVQLSDSTAVIALEERPPTFSVASSSGMPFAEPAATTVLAPHTGSTAEDAFAAALGGGDTLSYICNLAGLKQFSVMALVCTAWHDAIQRKMREWGMLTHLRTLGRGYGRVRGMFDMPTWVTLLPDGQLAIVDSCNYRIQILRPSDGVVTKVVGRPGARPGQLSSPSSVAYSPLCGPRRVFSTSNVGPSDRRVMAFDLESWNLVESTPEGSGKTELDAPEGMAVADGRIFVVDTANHKIVSFDLETLERRGTYPPADVSWGKQGRGGKHWDQLSSPHDICEHAGELFVSDTHNDRIQVFSTSLQWLGVIGCRGRAAGQFIYPRGVCVAGVGARKLLYVCEDQRIQALTLLGEPRIVMPVPGAVSLCGIVCDGRSRVYCTDMDAHVVHVLRLTHEERWQEKRREAIAEARARKALRSGDSSASGGVEGDDDDPSCAAARKAAKDASREAARTDLERQRDRAIASVLGGKSVRKMLGLPAHSNEVQIRHAVRLAMRLLHPDRTINVKLKKVDPKAFAKLEAAFKVVNNLKDVERIESWMQFDPQEL